MMAGVVDFILPPENMALDEIKKKVYDYKDRIEKEGREFNLNTLREKWFGQDRNTRAYLRLWDWVFLVWRDLYGKVCTESQHLQNIRLQKKF